MRMLGAFYRYEKGMLPCAALGFEEHPATFCQAIDHLMTIKGQAEREVQEKMERDRKKNAKASSRGKPARRSARRR